MNFTDRYDQIERYLKGVLSGSEKADFEAELLQNPQLASETEKHKILLESLQLYAKRREWKAQFEAFHQEFEKEKSWLSYQYPAFKSFWKKHLSTVSVAASVALVTVFGILWQIESLNNLESQQITNYKDLKNEISDVKKQQKSLEEKTEKGEEVAVIDHTATAFVISANGYLVTNFHAVKDATSIFIESKHDSVVRYQVETFYTDEKADIAILKIKDTKFTQFMPLPYGVRYDVADLGEEVFTLAYPREDLVYGEGSVSSKTGFEGDSIAYQVSIPVNPGNSGSPLIDEKGNLIGIIRGKNTAQEGAAFAVKAKYLVMLADSLSRQNPEKPILLPKYNQIQYLKRPQQIKLLQKYVFELKVYQKRK